MDKTNQDQSPCCETGVKAEAMASVECPACGTKGKAVKPITIESLVVEQARRRVGRPDGFRFCAEPSCSVAYYHSDIGARIMKDEVRVRIGQKVTESPRPICYCFQHTVEEIEAEVVATGASRVAEDITEKCRQRLDRCEETNPQGSCCLGNVRRAEKLAQARSAPVTLLESPGDAEDCCAVPTAKTAFRSRSTNASLLATTGAVVSAVLSSACCWLPLLLIAFGASAAGVAGFFEAYRPYLLGATGLLLASGFYLVYFRKQKCGPGEACAVPNPRLQRVNRSMLWGATAVVVAFTLFPNYVGYLLGGNQPRLPAVPTPGESRVFQITGMTCEACAMSLREHLGRVPGVARVEVSFETKTAHVLYAARPEPSEAALLEAIREAGYSGTPIASSRTVRIALSGMTWAGCASALQARLQDLAGVEAAQVDYESARATITITRNVSLDTVLQTIREQGFAGKIEPPEQK
jgi:copper chaperone CopZ